LFNYATLGFYWPSYEPRQGEPNHAYTEEVARWCREHGITPKGHPLAWNFTDPGWLPDDTAEIKRLQLERITDCVTRFRGLIDVWDVVNEATHFEREEFVRRAPKMTRMWEETGRIPFVNECFQAARAAHPDATLLINDYRTDEAYVQLIEAMAPRDDKPAYDVIGIQSHMHGGVWPNQKLWEVCERFAPFNVPLHFTELTILSGQSGWERTTPWDSTPEGEQRQAEDVRRVYTMLFSHPAVAGITWWDFADRHAWQQAPAGLVGKDLRPKPAYRALKELVRDRWWTRDQATTDAAGQASFRGFLGEYLVTVAAGDGRDCEVRLNVSKNAPNQFEVRLP
jgi:GH35 family endo-1,4-beta-xylanase